jgi:hypothetical protein
MVGSRSLNSIHTYSEMYSYSSRFWTLAQGGVIAFFFLHKTSGYLWTSELCGPHLSFKKMYRKPLFHFSYHAREQGH